MKPQPKESGHPLVSVVRLPDCWTVSVCGYWMYETFGSEDVARRFATAVRRDIRRTASKGAR